MSLAKGNSSFLKLLSAILHANPNSKFIILFNQQNCLSTSSNLAQQDINKYPPIGSTSESSHSSGRNKKMSPLSKLLLTSAFFGGIGIGGMVLYGREDPRFRKRMVENYPPTRYFFDFFLGPFGMTPYLIPAYEFKEGVKEKVNDATETIKDQVARHVPVPGFIKKKLQPAVEEAESVATELADHLASGMLPNADPSFFTGEKGVQWSHTTKNETGKIELVGNYENDEYTSRLVNALAHAQNQVSEVVQLKNHLIQDYQHQNIFLINITSLASRNEETDARKAIAHLKKVISEGRNSPHTSKNPYITSAAQTAAYFTKQLDQLDYLEQMAKHDSDQSSDAELKLIWD